MGLAPRPQGSPALCCRRSPQMCDQSLGVDDSNARERGLVSAAMTKLATWATTSPRLSPNQPASSLAAAAHRSSYRQGVLCHVRVRELADSDAGRDGPPERFGRVGRAVLLHDDVNLSPDLGWHAGKPAHPGPRSIFEADSSRGVHPRQDALRRRSPPEGPSRRSRAGSAAGWAGRSTWK